MKAKHTKFKVAAAHAAPIFMNKAATIQKTIALIEQAAHENVKLLVFPETFIPGYPVSHLVWSSKSGQNPHSNQGRSIGLSAMLRSNKLAH